MPTIQHQIKNALFVFCFFFSVSLTAQVTFMKGNFVNSQNVKVECLIKNYDWNNYPSEIEYKLNDSEVVEKIYTAQLQSFYIYETPHYYKKYDVASIPQQPGGYSLKSGLQLLKVLLEGKVSLLRNTDDVYFLGVEDQSPIPLINYKYINDQTQRVERNNSFRLELLNNLKCHTITSDDIRKVSYGEKDLVKIVSLYNACVNSESKNYTSKKAKAEFNIKLVGGVNLYTTNLDLKFISPRNADRMVDLSDEITLQSGSESNFVAGFEAEVRLPFNHKKWALFIVPTYNKQKGFTVYQPLSHLFSANNYETGYRGDVIFNGYSYIEIPLGLRRYFYLNKNSLINLNLSYGLSVTAGSDPSITVNWNENSVRLLHEDTTSNSSLLRIGAGYTFKDKYTLGVNYYAIKSLSKSNTNGSLSVILGYKIL
ncbi:hypothetical protein GR160_15530 [Flavobacterium sp. Sd200]|uniref:hypothetical protein n=1 Tax=Flavobacterium sp. Sd200 TaxID=2692211 RepID=UPI001370D97A|nr:hypothetical protein [Flavobacterium sp. Sd200]MXN92639.1 hypothetical protein [Flavobacterium sp. Sd200]